MTGEITRSLRSPYKFEMILKSADNRIRTRESSHLADVMRDTLLYLEPPFSDLNSEGVFACFCVFYTY